MHAQNRKIGRKLVYVYRVEPRGAKLKGSQLNIRLVQDSRLVLFSVISGRAKKAIL